MNTSSIHRTILFLPALLILAACSSGFDPQAYVPGLETATPPPQAAPMDAEISEGDLIPRQRVVCTGVPAGRVNVRFQAGEVHAVRGYLEEGEVVLITGITNNFDQATWMELDRPIQGWVNARYLCEASQ